MKKEVMAAILPAFKANTKNFLEEHETIKNKYNEALKARSDLETAFDDYKKRVNKKEVH